MSGDFGEMVEVLVARRALVAAVVVASAVMAVSGCSGRSAGSGGGSSVGGSLAAGPSGSPAAEKALTATATQLRQQVALAKASIKASVAAEQVIVDNAAPCDVSATAWPQRWGYSLHLTLSSSDPVAASKVISTLLGGQGWSIASHPATSDVADFDARKGGVRLRVSGEPNPSTVTIEGYGACVGADGTVGTA